MSSIDGRRIGGVPGRPFDGIGWRNLSPAYDPRSGEGARVAGGRFNLPNSFPVLYLCLSRGCTIAELRRLGERQAISVDNLLPRYLYRYTVQLARTLDLNDEGVRADAGVGVATLVDNDWGACQILGVTAHALGFQAIRSPSATGIGDVLAVFVESIGLGTVEPELAEAWNAIGDLQPE